MARYIIGYLGLILSIGFAIALFMAVNSNGRISKDEFFPVALTYGILSLLLSIWLARNGEAEEAKEKKF